MKVISDKDRFVMKLNIEYTNTYDNSLINSKRMPFHIPFISKSFVLGIFLKAVGKT